MKTGFKLAMKKICLPFQKVYSLPSICFISHTISQTWRFLGEFLNVLSCMVTVFHRVFQCPAQARPSKHGPFGGPWQLGGTHAHFRTVRRSDMQPHISISLNIIVCWHSHELCHPAIEGPNIHNNCALKTCICGSMAKTTGKLFLAQRSSK